MPRDGATGLNCTKPFKAYRYGGPHNHWIVTSNMPLATHDIDFLRDLVAQHSGNVIAPRQVYMLEQRLAPLAQSKGLQDVTKLVTELRRSRNPGLSTQVAEAVTVNETSFFRDPHVFRALEAGILPEIVSRNRAKKELRIWCAACSSGQEPHSIAMTLREGLSHLSDWKLNIVATDLSEHMLRRSRAGEYSQLEVNRGLPAKKLVRFFERSGTTWRAKDELRNMISYRRLNLTQSWPYLGQFDIVFIRNVLIYFDQEKKRDILQRMRTVLKPDAYLFIGSAETIIGLGVPYERKEIHGTVCYRSTAV